MRKSWLSALFVAMSLAVGVFITATSGALPERVASHFSGSGAANGYMTRDGYRIFMLVFALGIPLLIVAVISWLPRLMPNLTNIPNRAYWLEPERRETAFAILSTYALWLGCSLVVLMGGVHWLLIRANTLNPPKLENELLIALLVAYVVTMILSIVMLIRRFRKTA